MLYIEMRLLKRVAFLLESAMDNNIHHPLCKTSLPQFTLHAEVSITLPPQLISYIITDKDGIIIGSLNVDQVEECVKSMAHFRKK